MFTSRGRGGHERVATRGADAVARTTSAALATKDASLRYRWASAGFAALHGVGDPTEIEGLTDADLVEGAVARRRRQYDERALATGRPVAYVERRPGAGAAPDATTLMEVSPVFEDPAEPATGTMTVALGGVRAARVLAPVAKQAERRLSELEQQLSTGTWELIPDTGEVAWSETMLRLHGLDPEDGPLTFDGALRLEHPDDQAAIDAEVIRAVTDDTPFSLVHRMIRADGEIRVLHSRAAVTRDPDGRIHLIGASQDITDRVRVDVEHEQLAWRHDAVLALVADGVVELDARGRVGYANPAAVALLGECLEGRDAHEALHGGAGQRRPRHLPEDCWLLHSVRAGAETREREDLFRRADGSVMTVECTSRPTDEHTPGQRGAVLTFRDVTEVRRDEARMRSTLGALERLGAERRRLLADVVTVQEEERERIAADIHDDTIGVLTAVALRLEGLEDVVPGDQQALVTDLCSGVREATGRLRDLMFRLAPPEIDRGLGSAVEQLVAKLRGQGARVIVDDRVPAGVALEAKVLLFRIAQECIVNAFKHAQARNIRVSFTPQDAGVLLQVVDDGGGASQERLEAVRPGHLGLLSVRRRAEAAGGWSAVTATPGGGVTVEAYIPTPESREDRP